MQIHIKIIGILLITLALLHIIIPRYFKWSKELKSLTLINRQFMIVHTFFIAFVVFLMGLLCVTSSNEIVETFFGKKISLGLGIFWAIRLLVQFFGYSTKLWKGKKFETSIHILASIIWAYFSLVFLTNFFI